MAKSSKESRKEKKELMEKYPMLCEENLIDFLKKKPFMSEAEITEWHRVVSRMQSTYEEKPVYIENFDIVLTPDLLDSLEQIAMNMPETHASKGYEILNNFIKGIDSVKKILADKGFKDSVTDKIISNKCSVCGKEFAPTRNDAKFCSAKCKQRDYRNRLKL